MGFGLLFIGYFLLLNLTYYGYTDLIGALIMFMALYKLQNVNRHFRTALIPTGLFGVVGMVELVDILLSTLGIGIGNITNYIASSRYLLIGLITIFVLMGIEDVAKEVDVLVTQKRAKYLLPFAYILYAAGTIFEFPSLGALLSPKVLAVTATVLLFSIFIHMALSLVAVYSAYMHICMPEDVDNDAEEKPSRFGFVNKFREHEESQNRKYAEYKIDKAIKKAEKKKRKRK